MADEKKLPVNTTVGVPSNEPPKYSVNKEMDGRVAKARAAFDQTQVPEPPAVTVEPIIEVAPETPPAELPAVEPEVVEEPAGVTPSPAEVVAEPVQAAPLEPAAPPVKLDTPPQFDWRKFREQERKLRKAEKELEALRAGKPVAAPAPETPETPLPAPIAPTYDETDPFGVKAAAEASAARVRTELQQKWETQRAADQQRIEMAELERQEKDFQSRHQDYYDAVAHLANFERNRYQLTGAANIRADQMMNDSRWQPAIERVADNYVFVPDPAQPNRMLTVERSKLTNEQAIQAKEMTDGDAAVCLAVEEWIRDRRNDVLNGARRTGRSVPELVWDMATNTLGYKPKAAAPAAKNGTAPAPTSNQTAAERVRQSARVSAAAKSLSAVSSAAPLVDQNSGVQIKTLRDAMEFQKRDPKGFRELNERMSKTNPSWYRDLGA